jgi:hypothetical protein
MDYRERFAIKRNGKVHPSRIDSNSKGGNNDPDSQRSATRPKSTLVATHGATAFMDSAQRLAPERR